MPARKKSKARRTTGGDHAVATRESSVEYSQDAVAVYACGALLATILVIAIWWNRFLPMQDFPQHLFMALVANTYDDPSFNWSDNFVLRNQFGPYRATHLALRGLCYITDPETSGKLLATLYVLLVALAAFRTCRQFGGAAASWGALVFFPLCMHPMYFYGFLNYFLSIPVLVLAVLELKPLIAGPTLWWRVLTQFVLQIALFLLHPYSLLVFIVLALASIPLLAKGRAEVVRAFATTGLAILLFAGGMWHESTLPASPTAAAEEVVPEWWSVNWNFGFLVMHFLGMNYTDASNWWVAGTWATLAGLVVCKCWSALKRRDFDPWIPALLALSLLGFFVLPFSIQSDGRYTFFNARMTPVCFFLGALVVAELPFDRYSGRLLAVLCLALTCHSALLHVRVAQEVESFLPVIEQIEPNAAILPLVGSSRSEHLDYFYFANFHHCFPFYYHILTGGGVNPDVFDRRLMPVGYREGRKPPRPAAWELQNWRESASDYDYVIARRLPPETRTELGLYGELLNLTGPWTLYKLRK